MIDAIGNIAVNNDPPNDRKYSNTSLGIWDSISKVDIFFNNFNRSNAYDNGTIKLSVGNYVTIQDGTYNQNWAIAGFDLEHGQMASDGTVYDNGYGICMIPISFITAGKWHDTNTTNGGYKSSYMHTTVLPGIVTKLKNVLGSHIVSRNVLLSDKAIDGTSTSYSWTTSDATLMSYGQVSGFFGTKKNKYDDGEAIYKLPIFNKGISYNINYPYWLRNIQTALSASCINGSGTLDYANVITTSINIRPIIFLR